MQSRLHILVKQGRLRSIHAFPLLTPVTRRVSLPTSISMNNYSTAASSEPFCQNRTSNKRRLSLRNYLRVDLASSAHRGLDLLLVLLSLRGADIFTLDGHYSGSASRAQWSHRQPRIQLTDDSRSSGVHHSRA